MSEKLLTVAEAATTLRLHPVTLRALAAAGGIPATRRPLARPPPRRTSTYTRQDAVVRWSEDKADKTTALEDRVKFQWLDGYLGGRLLQYDHA